MEVCTNEQRCGCVVPPVAACAAGARAHACALALVRAPVHRWASAQTSGAQTERCRKMGGSWASSGIEA
eukprot:14783656-Alexandrium_andersonii.AAC.1